MTRWFNDLKRMHPQAPVISWWLGLCVMVLIIAMAITFCTPAAHAASCTRMRAYAQASANQMAVRDSMGDHDYFRRQPHIGGENIGWGYMTEAAMVAAWWASPGHAANMRLGYPCRVTAHARSRSGRDYWAMEIGSN